MSYRPYNKPCKLCGSTNQVFFDDEDRKSIFCKNCKHYEDIYASEELKQFWEEEKAKSVEQTQININVPKCPTCNSTDIKKISTMSKVAGATMFGLFSKTARNQFCCNNCGYKW
ncbi:MAG: hypothetical protein NC313_07550 [Butyrivibrio sp.]|nr:hypothetical protein [Butyrivibrio sp.]